MKRTRAAFAAVLSGLLLTAAAIALAPPAAAAALTEVTDFGDNPGNLRMHLYVPDVRPAEPAILVAMHGCGGSGTGFYSGSEFAALADQYGFIVIYPTATKQTAMGNCFDVWSAASKTRGGGSDPASVVSMVEYAQQQYNGDAERVFVTGSSSGGMETNALLALYPDVFAAGSAFMGVPFTCFANEADFPPQTSRCVNGSMDRTPQSWGDSVRQAYPGYSGPRPRVQLWHGSQDNLVPYQLLQEAVDQWTNVFGLSQNPTATDRPQPNWERKRYADTAGNVQVEAITAVGAGHNLPQSGMARLAIEFFGLHQSDPGGGTTPPEETTPPPSGDCTAAVRVVGDWGSGWQGNVDVTAGSRALTAWTLTWTWPGGQTVSSSWNAQVSTAGTTVTARDVGWNGAVAAGQTRTAAWGFIASGSAVSPTVTCAAS
ncbi:extracellular catalytic domain type 1 short-chain-length polyhydroxyalkanoate depolymerase [Glycomyces harbinensis]|uniref:Esterase, PHB depolymerase family n=1 Tax=Glycomyces harbinensis TaxID=58114 RepID=A0A1G7AKQ8_9ACTN|nr:PHB depolymerase family esterase [Glycomyces harbinensis]SDE15478.1 esterase, PHB depolymerase family [Glycomyces harbinensis]